MQLHGALRRQFNMSITVRAPTITVTEFNNVMLDDFAETAESPISGLVQPRGSSSRLNEFFGRWPEASHILFCAIGVPLEVGYLLSWTDPEDNTQWGGVIGEPENAGGQAHHYEVPLVEPQMVPSGVT